MARNKKSKILNQDSSADLAGHLMEVCKMENMDKERAQTILIEKRLAEKLKSMRIANRESYNEIIWRFVNERDSVLERQKEE